MLTTASGQAVGGHSQVGEGGVGQCEEKEFCRQSWTVLFTLLLINAHSWSFRLLVGGRGGPHIREVFAALLTERRGILRGKEGCETHNYESACMKSAGASPGDCHFTMKCELYLCIIII